MKNYEKNTCGKKTPTHENVKADELSHVELCERIGSLLDGFDENSKKDTALLSDCYAALGKYEENDIIPDEKYDALMKSALDKYSSDSAKSSETGVILKRDKKKKPLPPKVRLLIAVATLLSAVLLSSCSISTIIPFSVEEMEKKLFKYPEKTHISQGSTEIVYTHDFYVYDTFESLLYYEKIDCVYPERLPDGYEPELIQFSDYGVNTEVMCKYSNGDSEIRFFIISDFTAKYENEWTTINGFNYMIYNYVNFYNEDVWQANWSYGGNYYTLVAPTREILCQILETMKGF